MTDQHNPDENISPDERATAWNPNVGTGTPATAPYEDVKIPWLRRQPLVALLLTIVLADVGALVTELASGSADPVLVALLGTVATICTIGGRIAWLHVTPTARPMLDRETPAAGGGEAGHVLVVHVVAIAALLAVALAVALLVGPFLASP